MTKVSIIMPAFNAERFISESISSVLNQTYQDWELIIINDGSTDFTEKIIAKFQEKDNRIVYLFQKNGRQGKARNYGITVAKGEYLAFLDADDFWCKDKLEQQITLIESGDYDLIFSNYATVDDGSNIVKQKNKISTSEYLDKQSIERFFNVNQIPILTVLCKKDCVLQAGGFSQIPSIQNAEDYHLWMKMLLKGSKFKSYEQVSAYYRIHEKQSTSHDFLATKPAIAALASLEITDRNIKYKRDFYLFRWIREGLIKNQDDILNDTIIYNHFRKNYIMYLIVSGLFLSRNSPTKKRLVIKYCSYKIRKMHV